MRSSIALQMLKQVSSRKLHDRAEKKAFWQKRYYDFNVHSTGKSTRKKSPLEFAATKKARLPFPVISTVAEGAKRLRRSGEIPTVFALRCRFREFYPGSVPGTALLVLNSRPDPATAGSSSCVPCGDGASF